MQRHLCKVRADLSGTTGPRQWGDPPEVPEAKTVNQVGCGQQTRLRETNPCDERERASTGGSVANTQHSTGVSSFVTPLLADFKDAYIRR